MSKLGLVLEGGGMRGIYTAGVLDFFMEQNLYTDGVIGVSAGACHACSYVSKQIGRAYRTNTAYLKCINMKRDVIYVRASASLPLLSRIVEVDGKKLLDGGATDSIPIHKFQEMGYTKNIVVLTQCKEYRKGKNNLLPMIRRSYKKYPKFIKALETRHIAYNRTLDELALMEKEGSVFLIRPSSPVEISRLEKNEARLRELYEQGYMDAKNSFEELKSFIANEN